jgi:hypothetical protein
MNPLVTSHLKKVYSTLSAASLACAVGVMIDLKYSVGGWLTLIGQFVALFALFGIPHNKDTIIQTFSLLLGFATLMGCSLGPLVAVVIEIDPTILGTAFFWDNGNILLLFSLSFFLPNQDHIYFWVDSSLLGLCFYLSFQLPNCFSILLFFTWCIYTLGSSSFVALSSMIHKSSSRKQS